MVKPYLIRTVPAFRNYLWGGRNLETVLGKALPDAGIWAESWEIVDHSEHQSVIANGEFAGCTVRQLGEINGAWLTGKSARQPLPLLLKYLDCQRVLSVQVHPDDAYALKMTPPDLGKTEAWYVVSANPGSVLYAGLKAGVTKDSLEQAIAAGDIESCLHVIKPQADDCVFIPAGTVHALGEGLLVAEIQQSSNTTFRLHDWNRVDAEGRLRPLHLRESLEVIDFQRGPIAVQRPEATNDAARKRLVACDKFVFDRIQGQSVNILGDNRFHFMTAPKGGVTIRTADETVRLDKGQSILAPACMERCKADIADDAMLLDMYLD
jgi:mannose-6-phosphate isomerase